MTKPFLHLFVFNKLKEGTKTDIVDKRYIKETIGRIIVRRGGLPHNMVKYIVDDLVELELIVPINNRDLYRLSCNGEERKIRKLLVYF